MKEVSQSSPQGAPAALLNGLAILEAFSQHEPALSVTEIAERVGLHKSTVSRVLHGLANEGYVLRDGHAGKYQLDLRVLRLAAPLMAELDARIAAHPHLELLSRATEETAALALWNGKNVVVVDQVASPHQVKHTASVGTQYNRWQSSAVRTVLSQLPIDEVRALVAHGHVDLSPAQLSESEIDAELERVQRLGYAINEGATTPEEFGVSSPIFDTRGQILGGIVVSAPLSRVKNEGKAERLADQVKQAAAAVTARLGAPAS
ncbi:IclR family transcriptional regulator [Micrococcoides hystricis]|uniref:IclR family transcriptional regulator n=1 Tax=Micrococcoides hystricis TaxID=1572761 RepID=A0ABV6P8T0_9MICC